MLVTLMINWCKIVTSSDGDGASMVTFSGDDGARWQLAATKDKT
jgi:hypothetical protein